MCNAVSPGFFTTLGIPLRAGREFTERDALVGPAPQGWPYRVAVVNETFVRRYFKGANPLGRHVGIGQDPGTPTPIEVVGVVKDSKHVTIRQEPVPQIFFPYLQSGQLENVTAYVRTEQDPDVLMPVLRRRIASLDPQLAVYDVSTLEERVERSVVNERLIASLSATLSVMATVLSIVGLYGVMAYMVTRRTREIGIRMALGALSSQIARGVLREAGVLVAIGLGLGFGAAWWLGRYVQSQLYGVSPADTTTIATSALILASVACLASALPARRAARVSPLSALRDE